MNSQQMGAILSRPGEVYSKPITADLLAAWLDAMADMPAQLVAAAMSEYIRSGEWFPKPTEVRRIALRMRTEQAQTANREYVRRTGQSITEEAISRGDGAAMVRFILGRLHAAGSNPEEGKYLGSAAAAKVSADAVEEWREAHPETPVGTRPGRHCGRDACRCTHTNGCEAGWVEELPDRNGNERVRACPQCNERRARVLSAGDPREIAMSNLRVTALIAKRESH